MCMITIVSKCQIWCNCDDCAICCSDMGVKLKHPMSKWQKFSIRNTRIMRAIYFSIENLPFLLFTHACTFVLGAATYVNCYFLFRRWHIRGFVCSMMCKLILTYILHIVFLYRHCRSYFQRHMYCCKGHLWDEPGLPGCPLAFSKRTFGDNNRLYRLDAIPIILLEPWREFRAAS